MSEAPSILISKFNLIGDVFLATGMLAPIKKKYPDAKISFAAYSDTVGVLANNPQIDKIYSWDRKKRGVTGRLYSLKYFSRFLNHHHDIYLCLRDSYRSRYLGMLAGAKTRVCAHAFDTFESRLAYTRFFQQVHLHACEKDRRVLEAIDIPCSRYQPEMHPSPEDLEKVRSLLPDDCFVQLHPFARWKYKMLPDETLTRFAESLTGSGLKLVLTGAPSPEERRFCSTLAAHLGDSAVDLCGQLSLPQLYALSSRAKIYAGCDTAALHIAAGAGCPCLAWFGPSYARNWGPWDPDAGDQWQNTGGIQRLGKHTIVASTRPCLPCNWPGCPGKEHHSLCLDDLTPATLSEEAFRMILEN